MSELGRRRDVGSLGPIPETPEFISYRRLHCDDLEGEEVMIDEKKRQLFLGKMMIDLGAAISVPLMRIGVRLGLYKAMDGVGPMTSAEFATKGKHLRTLCPRMARAKRGLWLFDLRPGQSAIRVAAGTGDGIRERGRSFLHRRWI